MFVNNRIAVFISVKYMRVYNQGHISTRINGRYAVYKVVLESKIVFKNNSGMFYCNMYKICKLGMLAIYLKCKLKSGKHSFINTSKYNAKFYCL